MATAYFLSDAHLGIGNRDRLSRQEDVLIDFLDRACRSGDALFILGDLFDFWFEYDSVIPGRYFRTLVALQRCRDRGVRIEYFTGNHDFWMGSFFPDHLGVSLHREPVETRIGGRRFWIGHGDGIMKQDRGYRLLKSVLRHPAAVAAYRCLHPDLAFGIAHFFSRLSRNHPAFPDRDRDYLEFAESRFSEGFDCVVMAHTHSPRLVRRGRAVYCNTGDWIRHFTYGKFRNGRLTLEKWPAPRIR
jgi:UDP-2,3-diacylglucosamine hydrolase